ncbi:glycoside hydrolase family 25 protein [Mucilaginibacter sp. KACC 22063]|uniref:glycoside hydrolase family 25 protein n=1 Tax=Mucilaginibacter sp. KACC 22063 TaxID=3025666 RepID=UPI002366925D|nr:GH25 family lysozyme [Mucilaginibacter sp. KACC 22063]WDF54436.1 GH25 family lysozyme [Mucilaginibacter sp. KACC 22063]
MSPVQKKPAAKPKVPSVKQPAQAKKPAKPRASAKKKTQQKPNYWPVIAVVAALILFSPFYYKLVTRSFTSAWHWLNDIGENANYRHYKSFNIHVSEKYTVHGIDVSYAQGKINWKKVKEMDENGLHISFAFIKATEGEKFVDTYFQRNWREAAKTGLICGAYHFFRPEKNGRNQAKLLLKTVKLESNDLPLVIDVEKLDGVSPEKMRSSLDQCLSYLKYHGPGKPIIYSGLSFYTDYLKGYFDEYPLWIAHYDQPDERVNKAANWQFWQHSDKATVNGIHHAVDFDTFRGDSLEFSKFLIH